MSIKSAIIKTNDVLAYIAFVAVAIIALAMAVMGKPLEAMLFSLVGWIVCCLVFGFWFALSEIAGNLRKIAERNQ